jgi:signal transduction histidine kinase
LRAKPLEDLGLALAIRSLAESYASRSDMQLEVDIDNDLGNTSADVQQSIYRIAQEALANAADHSRAQNIQVSLKREKNILRLTVQDDGCGFDPNTIEGELHYGLLGMQERARMIGGDLSIESQLGKGTQISFQYGDSR